MRRLLNALPEVVAILFVACAAAATLGTLSAYLSGLLGFHGFTSGALAAFPAGCAFWYVVSRHWG